MITMQKEIQNLALKNSENSHLINGLKNDLEVKMRKKDCLDLILGELIFQMQRLTSRWEQVEKINSAVAQAQSLAAKKAKINRINGIKGSVFLGSPNQTESNTGLK